VGLVDPRRLTALEARLGVNLPDGFGAALADQEPIREGRVALITPDRVWDVRTTFRLDNGGKEDQLDRVYELVGDVLPAEALPFAEDWGGNLYCLMLSGPRAGQVVFWDHERDEGDHWVEPVAGSIEAFYAGLVPDSRESDA
jgi:SMI1 / KNR4 family (SUKH-1)